MAKTVITILFGGDKDDPRCAHTETLRGARQDSVTLKPGRNVVDLSTWQRIEEAHKKEGDRSRIAQLTKQGLLKVMRPSEPASSDSDVPGDNDGDGATDLGSYDAKTAIEIVESTLTNSELDALEAEENAGKNRKTVLKAIADQRMAITPPDESVDGEDEDEADDE